MKIKNEKKICNMDIERIYFGRNLQRSALNNVKKNFIQ